MSGRKEASGVIMTKYYELNGNAPEWLKAAKEIARQNTGSDRGVREVRRIEGKTTFAVTLPLTEMAQFVQMVADKTRVRPLVPTKTGVRAQTL